MKKYIILFTILLTPPLYLVAESFVVAKPKKVKQSRKKLQEQCCDLCADLIENTSKLIGSLSKKQVALLNDVRDFINGESKSSIASAHKEQLVQLNNRMKKLLYDMQQLQSAIQAV